MSEALNEIIRSWKNVFLSDYWYQMMQYMSPQYNQFIKQNALLRPVQSLKYSSISFNDVHGVYMKNLLCFQYPNDCHKKVNECITVQNTQRGTTYYDVTSKLTINEDPEECELMWINKRIYLLHRESYSCFFSRTYTDGQNMLSVIHPNILHTYRSFALMSSRKDIIYITLTEKSYFCFEEFNENHKFVLGDLTQALLYLGQQNIIHADLKPQYVHVVYDCTGQPIAKLKLSTLSFRYNANLKYSAYDGYSNNSRYHHPDTSNIGLGPWSDVYGFSIIYKDIMKADLPLDGNKLTIDVLTRFDELFTDSKAPFCTQINHVPPTRITIRYNELEYVSVGYIDRCYSVIPPSTPSYIYHIFEPCFSVYSKTVSLTPFYPGKANDLQNPQKVFMNYTFLPEEMFHNQEEVMCALRVRPEPFKFRRGMCLYNQINLPEEAFPYAVITYTIHNCLIVIMVRNMKKYVTLVKNSSPYVFPVFAITCGHYLICPHPGCLIQCPMENVLKMRKAIVQIIKATIFANEVTNDTSKWYLTTSGVFEYRPNRFWCVLSPEPPNTNINIDLYNGFILKQWIIKICYGLVNRMTTAVQSMITEILDTNAWLYLDTKINQVQTLYDVLKAKSIFNSLIDDLDESVPTHPMLFHPENYVMYKTTFPEKHSHILTSTFTMVRIPKLALTNPNIVIAL